MHLYIRGALAFFSAIAILAASAWYMIGPRVPRPIPIENFLAYNATFFVALGFAGTVTAADKWAVACLWGGSALFTGAIFGILFGVPTAADAVNTQATQDAASAHADAVSAATTAGAAPPPQPPPPAKNHTLLADTASFVSKFLAGAGLAQFKNILNFFLWLSHSVAAYIVLPLGDPHAAVAAAGILLYFGLIGFLSGLILPYYFLKNFP
jgi:hypothetical protein